MSSFVTAGAGALVAAPPAEGPRRAMSGLSDDLRIADPRALQHSPATPKTHRPLRVIALAPGAELYGSDRMFLEAVRGLREAGCEVSVAVPAPGPLVELLSDAGARVDVVPTPVLRRSCASPAGLARLAADALQAAPHLWSYLSLRRPDVLYVNTATLPLWCALGVARRIPSVVHVHEAESQTARPVRAAMSSPLIGASTTIFNSRTSADLVRHDLGRSLGRARVIPNAVAFPEVPAPRERLAPPVRLLYVGRVSHRKGVDVALEALATLAAEGLEAHLDIVGDIFAGNEAFAAGIRRRAEAEDLRGRVTFHGFHDDPAPFMADADIVLVPSRGPESFGNVLVEAVGAGRPTVAAAQYGLVEATSGLGSVRLVPPADPRALADAVRAHVETWPLARGAAALDALVVRERHAVASYRAEISRTLHEAAGRPPAAGTGAAAGTAPRATVDDLVDGARVLVVSPHLDDAVLSTHALLDLGARTDVLTVFDGAPTPPARTGWDHLCGFADSDEAVAARHAENARAFSGTPHHLLSLGLCDAQYIDGPRTEADEARLREAVTRWLAAQAGRTVVAVPAGAGLPPSGRERTDGLGRRARRARLRRAVGPLGRRVLDVRARIVAKSTRPAQHEDHVWVRDVVLAHVAAMTRVVLYEDIPYMWGQRADEEVARLGRDVAGPFDLAVGVAEKARRAGAYRSQLAYMHSPHGGLDTPAGMPATERYWAVTLHDGPAGLR